VDTSVAEYDEMMDTNVSARHSCSRGMRCP
jgi:hypothetical protein